MTTGLSGDLLDMLPFGVLIAGEDLRVRYLNQWLRAYLEERADAVLDVPLPEAFPELLDAGRLAAFQLVLQTGQAVVLSTRLHRYLIQLPAPVLEHEQWMPQLTYLLPSLNVEGRPTGVVALIYDQSETLRTERSLQRELQKVRILYEIDHALTTLRMQDSLEIIVEHIHKKLNADQVAVLLQKGNDLEIAAGKGVVFPPRRNRFSVYSGLSGWVLRTGVPVVVGDVRKDRRYLATDAGLRSAIVVPLHIQGRVAGVISVESRELDAFTHEHLNLLEALAARAAIAIQNASLYQQAEQRRAYFEAVLDQTGDVIFTLDSNLCITTVNAAWDEFARQNGAPELVGDKALGRNVLHAMTPEMRRKWEPILRSLLAGERETYTEDIPCHAPMQERWLNLRIASLRDAHGKVAGLVCSTRDISARVLAERQLRRANSQLHVLLDAMRLMSSQLSLQALLDSTVNFLCSAFDVPAAAFYAWNTERRDFEMQASRGLSEAYHALRLPPLEDASGEHIQHFGMTSYVPDLRRWLRSMGIPEAVWLGADGVSSILLARVYTHRQFAGLLMLCAMDAPRHFGEDERDLLESLAAQFGVALENARAFAEQQALAVTDALTGLYNRRQFNLRLEEEVGRAARYQEPVALVMVDIDDFKSFNDTFGHPAGDRVLKSLAIVMRSHLRRVDMVARYGGEEFAIILPRALPADAYRVAERIRAAVEAQMQPIVADICADAAPEKPPREKITISMGVAGAPRHAQEAPTLLNLADVALYEAKRRGKNQVCLYRSSDTGALLSDAAKTEATSSHTSPDAGSPAPDQSDA